MTCVYAVFDLKAEAFLQPYFDKTDGLATRRFGASCTDPEHLFNRYSEDYSLFLLGIFDEETGKIDPCTPRQIASAAAFAGGDESDV